MSPINILKSSPMQGIQRLHSHKRQKRIIITINLLSFVETPRKFIIAELSIRKLESSSVLIILLLDILLLLDTIIRYY